jgi:hypothetical protein
MNRPIMITLQQIKDQRPCTDGWATVLKSKGGTKADFSAEFPLTDVLESNGLDDTLWCLHCLPEHSRIWRKYAVWCARQVEHLMTDQRSRNALKVADLHADGLATDVDLAAASEAARAALAAASEAARAALAAASEAAWAAEAAAWAAARAAALAAAGAAGAARAALAAAGAAVAASGSPEPAQTDKLREILTVGEWVEESSNEHD